MHTINFMALLMIVIVLTLSSLAMAHEGHEMTSSDVSLSNAPDHFEMHMPEADMLSVVTQDTNKKYFSADDSDHEHHLDHGGQIYQASKLDNQWRLDKHGRGELNSELETWVGTDETKLFIKAHGEKVESENADYAISALFSRNIAEFWDAQVGLDYRRESFDSRRQGRIDVVFGLHGVAPYFFETDAYLYAGQDQHLSLNLETERDILLTQKLITQPYLKADILLHDEADYTKKTGFSSLQAGVQIRYEINKQIMPFIDVAYRYEKGDLQRSQQIATASQTGWLYGSGVTFKF